MSATLSWEDWAYTRTFLPSILMGNNTSGTAINTIKVNCTEVNNMSINAPVNVTTERIAMDNPIPITLCSTVVSLVKREITSPVRFSA